MQNKLKFPDLNCQFLEVTISFARRPLVWQINVNVVADHVHSQISKNVIISHFNGQCWGCGISPISKLSKLI